MKKYLLRLRIEELKEDIGFYMNKAKEANIGLAMLKEKNENYESRIKDLLCYQSGIESKFETMLAEIESLKNTNHIYRERLKYCAHDIKALQMRK